MLDPKAQKHTTLAYSYTGIQFNSKNLKTIAINYRYTQHTDQFREHVQRNKLDIKKYIFYASIYTKFKMSRPEQWFPLEGD